MTWEKPQIHEMTHNMSSSVVLFISHPMRSCWKANRLQLRRKQKYTDSHDDWMKGQEAKTAKTKTAPLHMSTTEHFTGFYV